MQRSTDRFLTTHTGSLPRPDDLIKTMFAKEEGVPIDPAALAERVRSAVAEIVARQVDAGVDVVNDGEMSKPSYATYVKDRLGGFNGTSQPLTYQDLTEFPVLRDKVFGDPGRSRRKTPACTEAIVVVRPRGAADGRPQPRRRARRQEGHGVPHRGVARRHRALLPQRPLRHARGVPLRHRGRDEGGVRRGGRGGLVLQLDCPDLAMGRHIQFADRRSRRVPRARARRTSRR